MFLTELTLPINPHDSLYAKKLRVILDRFGLLVENNEDLSSAELGFRIICEAYNDFGVIAIKNYEGIYTGQADPAEVIKTIALGLFPDSQGNPLTIET